MTRQRKAGPKRAKNPRQGKEPERPGEDLPFDQDLPPGHPDYEDFEDLPDFPELEESRRAEEHRIRSEEEPRGAGWRTLRILMGVPEDPAEARAWFEEQLRLGVQSARLKARNRELAARLAEARNLAVRREAMRGGIEYRGVALKARYARIDDGPVIELNHHQARMLKIIIERAINFDAGDGDGCTGKGMLDGLFDAYTPAQVKRSMPKAVRDEIGSQTGTAKGYWLKRLLPS